MLGNVRMAVFVLTTRRNTKTITLQVRLNGLLVYYGRDFLTSCVLDLMADHFRFPWTVMLIQPIGINQPRSILFRSDSYGCDKSFFLTLFKRTHVVFP